MAVTEEFSDLPLAELLPWVQQRAADGWQFVQMCATYVGLDHQVDLLYSLRKGAQLDQRIVRAVAPGCPVPSITGTYLAAFPFENEAHDLFGVEIEGIAIDFSGKFYNVAVERPMTVLTPKQIAAREKAAAAAASESAAAGPAPAGEEV